MGKYKDIGLGTSLRHLSRIQKYILLKYKVRRQDYERV